jgi:hypothetical protein
MASNSSPPLSQTDAAIQALDAISKRSLIRVIENSTHTALFVSRLLFVPKVKVISPITSLSLPTVPFFESENLATGRSMPHHFLAQASPSSSTDNVTAVFHYVPVPSPYQQSLQCDLPQTVDLSRCLHPKSSVPDPLPDLTSEPLSLVGQKMIESTIERKINLNVTAEEEGPTRPSSPTLLPLLSESAPPDYSTVPSPPAYHTDRATTLAMRHAFLRNEYGLNQSYEDLSEPNRPPSPTTSIPLPSSNPFTSLSEAPTSIALDYAYDNLYALFSFSHAYAFHNFLTFFEQKLESTTESTDFPRAFVFLALNFKVFCVDWLTPHYILCHSPNVTRKVHQRVIPHFTCSYPHCAFTYAKFHRSIAVTATPPTLSDILASAISEVSQLHANRVNARIPTSQHVLDLRSHILEQARAHAPTYLQDTIAQLHNETEFVDDSPQLTATGPISELLPTPSPSSGFTTLLSSLSSISFTI